MMIAEKDSREMNHFEEAVFHEYLDGQLDPETHQTVERHLAACQGCRTQMAELQQVFGFLAAMPEVALPRDLSAQILAELPPVQFVRWPSWVRVILVGQVGLAVVLLLWLWPQIAPGWTALVENGRAMGETLAAGLQSRFALLELFDLFPAGELNLWPAGTAEIALLPVAQLAVLAGVALVAWFVGNALLLRRNEVSG